MMSFHEYIQLNEVEDFQDQVASGPLGKISIGKLAAFAKTQPKLLRIIPVQKVIHDLSWWQGDEKRMYSLPHSCSRYGRRRVDRHRWSEPS